MFQLGYHIEDGNMEYSERSQKAQFWRKKGGHKRLYDAGKG